MGRRGEGVSADLVAAGCCSCCCDAALGVLLVSVLLGLLLLLLPVLPSLAPPGVGSDVDWEKQRGALQQPGGLLLAVAHAANRWSWPKATTPHRPRQRDNMLQLRCIASTAV